MGKIKTFEEYIESRGKEKGSEKKDEMYRPVDVTKVIDENCACSKELQEKLWECYEMAVKEMEEFHKDDNKEHTAKSYLDAFKEVHDKVSTAVLNECDTFMKNEDEEEEEEEDKDEKKDKDEEEDSED